MTLLLALAISISCALKETDNNKDAKNGDNQPDYDLIIQMSQIISGL